MNTIEKFVRSRVKGSEPLIETLIAQVYRWLDKGYILNELEVEELEKDLTVARVYRIRHRQQNRSEASGNGAQDDFGVRGGESIGQREKTHEIEKEAGNLQ